METGDAHAIFHAPRHPYTQALLRALPEFAQDKERLASLPVSFPVSTTARTAACLTRAAPMPLTDVALKNRR